MLIFGLVLLASSTSLINLIEDKKSFGDRQQACQLAQNLTETMLALPLEEAKMFRPGKRKEWTVNNRFTVQTLWNPYPYNSHFEVLTIEYFKNNQSLFHLSVLHPVALSE
jgi:hypothetical protein